MLNRITLVLLSLNLSAASAQHAFVNIPFTQAPDYFHIEATVTLENSRLYYDYQLILGDERYPVRIHPGHSFSHNSYQRLIRNTDMSNPSRQLYCRAESTVNNVMINSHERRYFTQAILIKDAYCVDGAGNHHQFHHDDANEQSAFDNIPHIVNELESRYLSSPEPATQQIAIEDSPRSLNDKDEVESQNTSGAEGG